jgi:hypothetical protein
MAAIYTAITGSARAYATLTGPKPNKPKKKPADEKEDNSTVGMLKRQFEQVKHTTTMSSIQSKLRTGKRLTKAEKAYLKVNSPDLYDQAARIEQERENYKQELRRCRSKRDVEELRRRRALLYAAEANAVANNPNIPREKKQEYLDYIGMRVAAAEDEYTEFSETAEYKTLPEKTKPDKVDQPKPHRHYI